jgi:hypothetical protein
MHEPDPFDELRRGLRRGRADDADDEDFDGPARFRGRHLAVGGALAVLLAAAVFLTSAARPIPDDGADLAALADLEPVNASSTAASTTTASATERVWPAEPVEITGTEVRTGTHRWAVGEPGDLVAVGDWDCDGTATPAVVRPSAGRLFVFDEWATPDAPTSATPGPPVPSGVTAVSADGCGRVTIQTADGQTHVVPLEGAR